MYKIAEAITLHPFRPRAAPRLLYATALYRLALTLTTASTCNRIVNASATGLLLLNAVWWCGANRSRLL